MSATDAAPSAPFLEGGSQGTAEQASAERRPFEETLRFQVGRKSPSLQFSAVVAGLPLLLILVGVGLSSSGAAWAVIPLVWITLIASCFQTAYEVDHREVRLKQGPLVCWRIRLEDVSRVVPIRTRSSFSFGPIDALRIEYDGSRWHSAMAAEGDAFREALFERCPQLHRYGRELRAGLPPLETPEGSPHPRDAGRP